MVDDQQGEKNRKELRDLVTDFQKKLERYSQICLFPKPILKAAVSERTPVPPCLRLKGLSTRKPNQIEMNCLLSRPRSLKNKRQARKRRECTWC